MAAGQVAGIGWEQAEAAAVLAEGRGCGTGRSSAS